jgi:hypothetical protein
MFSCVRTLRYRAETVRPEHVLGLVEQRDFDAVSSLPALGWMTAACTMGARRADKTNTDRRMAARRRYVDAEGITRLLACRTEGVPEFKLPCRTIMRHNIYPIALRLKESVGCLRREEKRNINIETGRVALHRAHSTR